MPAYHETRRVTRFLWMPLTLQGERRWLTREEVVQVYYPCASSATGWDYTPKGWNDRAWGDRIAESEHGALA